MIATRKRTALSVSLLFTNKAVAEGGNNMGKFERYWNVEVKQVGIIRARANIYR